MSEVKVIRLTTGEDIIAKIQSQTSDHTEMDKAFVIIPPQKAPGQPVQLMMTPYMPYADKDTIKIRTANIVTSVDPKREILASYQQNTSRILTPRSELITETNIPTLKK